MASPVKFLLVDDLEPNLVALEGLLRREGLQLLLARSGAAALELLLVHDVSLAIIDVQMPEMDGFQLAELMRGTERTRRIPIIFVTAAVTDPQRRFRGYELGAVDFLSKPIDPHILRSKSETFFQLARQRTELKEMTDELRRSEEQVRQHAATLEKTVAERTARLADTVQELEAFSYTLAHDMRAPLRTMIGFADVICEEDSRLDQQTTHYLGRIKAAALKLDHLIDDLLRYSQIARAALPLERIELNEIVAEVVEHFPHIHAAKQHVDVAPNLPAVIGNRVALTQVFSNLLGNAVKFVPAGKTPAVRVTAERLAAGPDGASGDHQVRIWIEDNGIGIPEGAHDRLFRMFERFTTGSSYQGSGIGLAIARKAVERMGGSIGAESHSGEGSRFWFTLRLSD